MKINSKILAALLLVLTSCSGINSYRSYNWQPSLSQRDAQQIANLQQLTPVTMAPYKRLIPVRFEQKRSVQRLQLAVSYVPDEHLSIETYPLGQSVPVNRFYTDFKSYQFQDYLGKRMETGSYQNNLFTQFFRLPLTDLEFIALAQHRVPQSWLSANLESAYSKDLKRQIIGNPQKQVFFTLDGVTPEYFGLLNKKSEIKAEGFYQGKTLSIDVGKLDLLIKLDL